MITADAHMDIPWIIQKYGPRDLRFPSNNSIFTLGEAKAGKLDIGVFALYLSDVMQDSMTTVEVLNALDKQYTAIVMQKGMYVAHNSADAAYFATTNSNVSKNFVAMTALEGGRMLNEDLSNLSFFKSAYGIQYLTLLHNRNNTIGSSATDVANGGLTAFGKNVVKHCEAIGVKVDVSHCDYQTTGNVLDIATKPVLATHSGAYALVRHPRNISYYQLKAIANTKGFIGIPFARRFVGHHGIIGHINEIIDSTGSCDHVGIGSDIDGADMMAGFNRVDDWKVVVMDTLSNEGFSDTDIEKIAGGNLLRVLAS